MAKQSSSAKKGRRKAFTARDFLTKTNFAEVIIYLLFLTVICIITFGMTSTSMYYYTKVMSDLFVDKPFDQASQTSFRHLTNIEDFWRFAKGPLLDGLYWETWYNNKSLDEKDLGYIYYENKRLGVPRLRQIRVHSNSCVVHDDFTPFIKECFEPYSESIEDTNPFGLQDNDIAWYYKTEAELGGSSHWGLLSTYSGAGNIADLKDSKIRSADYIQYLLDNIWIRRGTRVVFIDFTTYNANINLFCAVRLVVEFPATGGAVPSWTFHTVKLIRYISFADYVVLVCECLFCLLILYYIIEEILELKQQKFAYFTSFWNILDTLVNIISIISVAFGIFRTIEVDKKLSALLDDPYTFADFERLSYWEFQFSNAIAIATFLIWIKIFKFISINKTMVQLTYTLNRCSKDLAGFLIMFMIIFLAFTQFGYLVFGSQLQDFSTFHNTFFTLFRIILGDFDFNQLETANRILGPIFFLLFVFFVFFVLINMFLAIINDTYSEVKSDMASMRDEFGVADFFKKIFQNFLISLNLKKDKISDIQQILQEADVNEDRQLDFREWQKDMFKRGYGKKEIEALFAKYDTDGDRVLGAEEQKLLQADLFQQKILLEGQSNKLQWSNKQLDDHSPDESDEDSDDKKTSKLQTIGRTSNNVTYDEFGIMSRRVDRMEHSISSIVSKIDAVLIKLDVIEKAKIKQRAVMINFLEILKQDKNAKNEDLLNQCQEELDRWGIISDVEAQRQGRRFFLFYCHCVHCDIKDQVKRNLGQLFK